MINDAHSTENTTEKEEFCPVAVCQRKIFLFVWYCGRVFEGGHKDNCPRADDNDDHLPLEEMELIINRRSP